MSNRNPPPIYQQLVTGTGQDETPWKASLPWITFFSQIYQGDTGQAWIPEFVGLTSTGTPTFSGTYYRLTQQFALYEVVITPATNTSSVAGTTYLSNFPLNIQFPWAGWAVSTDGNAALGTTNASNERIYTPTWTNITTPIYLSGIVRAT